MFNVVRFSVIYYLFCCMVYGLRIHFYKDDTYMFKPAKNFYHLIGRHGSSVLSVHLQQNKI